MFLFRKILVVMQFVVVTYASEMTFSDIKTLKMEVENLDIQIGVHPGSGVIVSDLSKQELAQVLSMSQSNSVLYIRYRDTAKKRPKIRIMLPSTCKLDVSAAGSSRVFLPKMVAPVRINANEYSEVTLGGSDGLIVRQRGASKVQIKYVMGDSVFDVQDKAEFGVISCKITTAIIKLRNEAKGSVGASINSLKLETRGQIKLKLNSVLRTLTWVGWGIEEILVERLSGVVDLMGNYNTRFTSKHGNIEMLYASTSSTAKIKVGGAVKNAALSVRGASEIVVDKLTGNLLRKSESNTGSIKVLSQ